jgi:hypothetical protein
LSFVEAPERERSDSPFRGPERGSGGALQSPVLDLAKPAQPKRGAR